MMLAARATRRPPYNAAAPLITPTPDGFGKSVHPGVVDMRTPWRGFRYWMAHTPYAGSAATLENPCILASHDGLAWEEPRGIVNPISPPLPVGFNSDTDLVYDPAGDRLICYWRDWDGVRMMICASTSTNGWGWSAKIDLHTVDVEGARLSPAYALDGTTWRSWWIDNGGPCQVRTATDPIGTWSAPTNLTFGGTEAGGVSGLWHGDIARHPDGRWLYLAMAPNEDVNAKLYAASSTDGIAWSSWVEVMASRADEWDRRLYRASLTVTPDGRDVRVWYSAYGGSTLSWRIGHTILPVSAWPDPPPA